MSDPEGGFKVWLRGQTSAGNHSFVSMPAKYDIAKSGPCIANTLLDDTDALGDAPWALTLMQFDCFGRTKDEAHTLYVELKRIIRGIECPTTLTTGTVAKGATLVPGSRYLPDESGTPRYVITAQVILSE